MFKSKCLTFFIPIIHSNILQNLFFRHQICKEGNVLFPIFSGYCECCVQEGHEAADMRRPGSGIDEKWPDETGAGARAGACPAPTNIPANHYFCSEQTFVQYITIHRSVVTSPFENKFFFALILENTDAKQKLSRTKTSLLSIPRIARGIGFVSCLTSP